MLEIDCHITSNEEVVVSHDNDLSRLTGHHQLISETDFQVIIQKHVHVCIYPSNYNNIGYCITTALLF